MAEFADASDRREAMKSFLNEAPAAEVAEQTPVETEAVETVEDLLETPAPKKGEPAAETVESEEEVAEEVEEEEVEEVEEEEEAETDEEREAREAEEAEASEYDWRKPIDQVEPEELVVLQDQHEAFEGLVEALDTTDYPINFGETPEELAAGMQEVGLRLADAHAMYQIMDGKGADGVFDRIKKFQGQEAHDFALNAVLQYAAKVGLIESADGAAAAAAKPGDKAAAASATETPREKELRLENERLKKEKATSTQTSQAQAAQEHRTKIGLSAIGEVERLLTEGEFDPKSKVGDMVLQHVMRSVGGNKAIINRVARGNFVDLQKFYDEAVNEIRGKRVATQNQKVQKRKLRDAIVPKRVAGEDRTRTAAVKPNFDLKTSEGRRAAAKAGLRG
jgi:hypothetical protein